MPRNHSNYQLQTALVNKHSRYRYLEIAMCRVGTVIMTSPGCNHARQNEWQDNAVGTHLSDLITRCSSCKPDQSFCGKLTIDSGLNARSGSSARRSSGVPQPPSLASLIQPTPGASPLPKNTLDGKCKFCTSYESEIHLADHIKRTLTDYNMALLFDEARLAVKAESKVLLIVAPILILPKLTHFFLHLPPYSFIALWDYSETLAFVSWNKVADCGADSGARIPTCRR